MAYYPKRTIRINQEQSKRYSEIKINKNIINYLIQKNDKTQFKKIHSLNEKSGEIMSLYKKYSLNGNIHNDIERKNKARRSFLYLLNKKSKGTFCPQIVEYFEEMRKLKNKKNELKEIKEEDMDKSLKEKSNKFNNNLNNNISKSKNQNLELHTKVNFNNYLFIKKNYRNSDFNEENNKDFQWKDTDYMNIGENEKIYFKGNKFNFNKEAQPKKKFLEDNKDMEKYSQKKKKSKSRKKNIKKSRFQESKKSEDKLK